MRASSLSRSLRFAAAVALSVTVTGAAAQDGWVRAEASEIDRRMTAMIEALGQVAGRTPGDDQVPLPIPSCSPRCPPSPFITLGVFEAAGDLSVADLSGVARDAGVETVYGLAWRLAQMTAGASYQPDGLSEDKLGLMGALEARRRFGGVRPPIEIMSPLPILPPDGPVPISPYDEGDLEVLRRAPILDWFDVIARQDVSSASDLARELSR